MTTDNLPAVRGTTTLATLPDKPAETTNTQVTAPMRLSTGLFGTSGVALLLAGISLGAHRYTQMWLCVLAAFGLLIAASVERYREHSP